MPNFLIFLFLNIEKGRGLSCSISFDVFIVKFELVNPIASFSLIISVQGISKEYSGIDSWFSEMINANFFPDKKNFLMEIKSKKSKKDEWL